MGNRGAFRVCIIVLWGGQAHCLCPTPCIRCECQNTTHCRHTCRTTARAHRHSARGSRIQHHCICANAPFGNGQCNWLYCHTGHPFIHHSHHHRLSSGYTVVAPDYMGDHGTLIVRIIVLHASDSDCLCLVPGIRCERHRHW